MPSMRLWKKGWMSWTRAEAKEPGQAGLHFYSSKLELHILQNDVAEVEVAEKDGAAAAKQ